MARHLLWAIWSFGAFALALWCAQFSGAPWRTALLCAALLVSACAAWAGSRMGEGAQLQWDGMHWSCTGAVQLSGAVAAVHLDFQSIMLVRLHEQGRAAGWFWLERSHCPARWLDLRRALHAAVPRAGAAEALQLP